MFQNRVLRRVIWPRRKKQEDGEKLHRKGIHQILLT
jgi:hypothetical protein